MWILVGFLFGIPKIYQNTSGYDGKIKTGFLVNTNLEQISDWFTKIIVGIGLVQDHKAWEYMKLLAAYISNKNGQPTSIAIVLIPLFLILGFLPDI